MSIPSIIFRTLDVEIERATEMVLTSDNDFGETTVYDFLYGIRNNLDNITRLASTIFRSQKFMDIETPYLKWTALHVAVICGDVGIAEWLIQGGANLNAKDHKNWTPLHFAAALGRLKCFEILLAAGADQSCETHLGGTIKDIVRCLKNVEKSDDTPIDLLGEDGKLLTYGDFKKVTGATYVRETHLSMELMWRQWENDAQPMNFNCLNDSQKNIGIFAIIQLCINSSG